MVSITCSSIAYLTHVNRIKSTRAVFVLVFIMYYSNLGNSNKSRVKRYYWYYKCSNGATWRQLLAAILFRYVVGAAGHVCGKIADAHFVIEDGPGDYAVLYT